MEFKLDDETFPLNGVVISQIKQRTQDVYTRDRQMDGTIKQMMKLLETSAATLENTRWKVGDKQEDDLEEFFPEEDKGPETEADRERRIRIRELVNSTSASLLEKYRELLDLKKQNDLLDVSAQQAVGQYTVPPDLENGEETNINALKAPNLAKLMDIRYEELYNQYKQMPQYVRFSEDNAPEYYEMRKNIWQLHHDTNLPNLAKEYSDYVANEDDEELVVEETKESFKCLLTKQYYENPVTSKVCHHSFSRDAIYQVFANSDTRKIKCPIPACAHQFTKQDLVPDEVLARRTEHAKARELREMAQQDENIDRL